MRIVRKDITLTHLVSFPRPAIGLVGQGSTLAALLIESIGGACEILSSNVHLQPAVRLDDWSLRLTLFNGLAVLAVTADGISTNFKRLATTNDLELAIDVQTRALDALSKAAPTLKYSKETLTGFVGFDVAEGAAGRAAYIDRIAFPGMTQEHVRRGFRMGMDFESAVGQFDVQTLWSSDSGILVHFDVDLSAVSKHAFADRANVARELIDRALLSLEFEVVE